MGSFTSNKSKDIIRRTWGKTLLEFLHGELKCKLIYMGLPSPEAEDIKEWLEYIDKVIAFQCRDYPNPSEEGQSRKAVDDLEELLATFERQNKLRTYTVYDGYLEEVVLNRKDNSNISFEVKEHIMLYNLDFCNTIDSPLSYTDEDGEYAEAYKFQVINELFRFQKEVKEADKFLLFLTIRANYNQKEFSKIIDNENEVIKSAMKRYQSLRGLDRKVRMLRLFVIYSLKKFFQINNYTPHFLPTIKYQGTGKANLLHFTVIGQKGTIQPDGLVLFNQSIEELFSQKFVTIIDDSLEAEEVEGLKERGASVKPVDSFTKTKTYKDYWKNADE